MRGGERVGGGSAGIVNGESWGRWMIRFGLAVAFLWLERSRKLESRGRKLRDAERACYKDSGCPMLCESFVVSQWHFDYGSGGPYLQYTGSKGGSQMSSPMEIHFGNTR